MAPGFMNAGPWLTIGLITAVASLSGFAASPSLDPSAVFAPLNQSKPAVSSPARPEARPLNPGGSTEEGEFPGYASITPKQYVLKAGDIVELRVFQEDALNARARVGRDGTVLLPLLGTVKVADLTVEQARRHVHALLAEDYLVNPQVMLTVSEFARARFTVLGQVQAPGMYELPPGESLGLIEAISLAGGFTRLASPGKITLKRVVDGREVVKQLDAGAMAKAKNVKQEQVLPGDIIYVGERIF